MDTAIFSNIYCFDKYYAGTEVENKIYDLITSERLKGLILTAESILNPDLQQYIYQRIVKRNVPFVVTGAELEGMVCINNDVTTDFEDITRHLVEVHHFTEIDVLTGWKEVETSQQRVQGCRNVLEEHGIAFPESMLFMVISGCPPAKSLQWNTSRENGAFRRRSFALMTTWHTAFVINFWNRVSAFRKPLP